jgi:multidrug resistance efflux pump
MEAEMSQWKQMIGIMLAVSLVAGCSVLNPAQATGIQASGTVEAVEVNVAPQASGRVAEVFVSEGDSVQVGDALFRMEDDLLDAQLAQAQANLELAQANLELVVAGTPPDQRQAAITAAELELTSARQALQTLHDTASLVQAQAELGVADADKALKSANDRLNSILSVADPEDVERANAQIIITKDALKKAKEDYDKVYKYYKMTHNQNVGRAYQQIKLANAQDAYDQAVTRLNNITGQSNRWEVAVAKANVTVAEEALAEAQRQLEKVQDGPDPDALQLAEQRLAAAEARLTAAQAGPSEEQLAVARQQVQVSQAAVDVLQAQLERLVVHSAVPGVVLTRNIQPGETIAVGTQALTIGELDHLTITVYIPEDQYGQIRLGEAAQVAVDSYPGQVFNASVTRIADQAEYTPRSVQTEAGRKTTVFAIELSVDNPDGKLKPGMPADVGFGPSGLQPTSSSGFQLP